MKNIFSMLVPSVLAAASIAIAGTSFSTAQAAAAAPTSKGSISYSATGTNTYNNSNGALSASVLFNYLSNNTLEVKLSNTALKGISDPSDVLTSVFWDYAGSPLNLTLLSATAPTVVNGSGITRTNANLQALKEWEYKSTTATTGLGGDATSGGTKVSQQYGLGTAGLGIFNGNNTGGTGAQFKYGVISGYAANANNPVKGGEFVKDYATFIFSGLAANFDVNNIGNVRFQYGTNLAEANLTPKKPIRRVPEPTTIVALGLFAVGALKLTTKNKNLVSQN